MRQKKREQIDVDLWPVYEFRPSPEWLPSWGWSPTGYGRPTPVYRFNGGAWIEDDGEHDIAFACLDGPPLCLYVSLPYQRNILWSWLTTHWTGAGPESHPTYRGSFSPNPWHYMLRDGADDWGGSWGRDRHENTKAGDAGMSWVSSRRGCANGRHVEWHLRDPHIAAGLVRRRDTQEVVTFPAEPVCMYCGPRVLAGVSA
jgi:hypothetical protein